MYFLMLLAVFRQGSLLDPSVKRVNDDYASLAQARQDGAAAIPAPELHDFTCSLHCAGGLLIYK